MKHMRQHLKTWLSVVSLLKQSVNHLHLWKERLYESPKELQEVFVEAHGDPFWESVEGYCLQR